MIQEPRADGTAQDRLAADRDDDVYERLARHLEVLAMGLPRNEVLLEVLRETLTPFEAEISLLLPTRVAPLQLVSVDEIATATDMPRDELAAVLEDMACRRLLFSGITAARRARVRLAAVGLRLRRAAVPVGGRRVTVRGQDGRDADEVLPHRPAGRAVRRFDEAVPLHPREHVALGRRAGGPPVPHHGSGGASGSALRGGPLPVPHGGQDQGQGLRAPHRGVSEVRRAGRLPDRARPGPGGHSRRGARHHQAVGRGRPGALRGQRRGAGQAQLQLLRVLLLERGGHPPAQDRARRPHGHLLHARRPTTTPAWAAESAWTSVRCRR